MDNFTVLDGIVAALILLSAVLAYSRGFVREVLAIGGWVIATVVAYYFAPLAEPLMREVPVLNSFLGSSGELSMIAAFAAVFAVALILVSFFTPLFAGIVQRSAIGGIDQGLGFMFGVLRGALLVAIAMVLYDRAIVSEPFAFVDESRTAAIYAQVSDALAEQIPEDAPAWIAARYEDLMSRSSIAPE
ncbi:CvpA family protein [Boseongicola aestuarii]|jgi:membrane protein required for colicin V production|uniref:Colicin V production protein n=1 Tax=Boseongicola aestuarii TaxID=1470561 RepID=A0A238J0W5_9RHOB|nr:CvpA family protein [Boseongicola aestuarii]SMX24369.1 Colicin V production protein [Boseongicola aestuarii]